ncbi:HK97 gp10 family phage protein [Salibacterium lacus]|uniref:HK97 gp10 family phage protein n=1 Tax=Salibacterium lacus TaxID=1898109 RepID=A0ABW5SZA3_9BACI
MPRGGVEVDLDLSGLVRLLDRTDDALGEAAQGAAKGIAKQWQQESRDHAPVDKGFLRRQISQKLDRGTGSNVSIEMSSNTYRKDFNYSYYQHEVKKRKYLDTTAEENREAWRNQIRSRLIVAAKKEGW